MTDAAPKPDPAEAPEATPDEAAVEETSESPRGLTIGSRYQIDIDAPLSASGSQLVVPGIDLRTRVPVVARTLREPWKDDAEERIRFRREARMQGFINHPNLARVEAYVEEPDGFWTVQERLPGGNLADRLAREGAIATEDLAPVLEQAAEALAELHRQGVTHLALSPCKLMFGADGRLLKLLDLGLAAQIGQVPGDSLPGPGSLPYRSPEQVSGEPTGPESDVYSLGAIAFEALTGMTPANAVDGAPENGAAVVDGVPLVSSLRPGLPDWLDGVLAGALAVDPARRDPDIRLFARNYRAGVEGRLTGTPMEIPAPVSIGHRAGPRDGGQWVAARPLARTVAAAPGAESGRERVERRDGERRPFAGVARLLWLAVGALLALNLLAAGVLLVRDHRLPPFGGGSVARPAAGGFKTGDSAVVSGSGLLALSEPSANSVPVAELVPGEIVTVAGEATTADGASWLPVTITRKGAPLPAWVQEGWLRARG